MQPKVVIGFPHLGDIKGYFFDSMMQLRRPPGSEFVRLADKPVDTARNLIAKTFVANSEFTHLFFADSDMRFHPHTLPRLLAHNLPIVSGLYLARTDTPLPHIYDFDHVDDGTVAHDGIGHVDKGDGTRWYNSHCSDYAEWLKCNPQQADFPNAHCFDPDPAALIECDAVGFGCVLIERRVFETIEYPWFEADPETGGAEDFDFCEKAKRAGFQVFADMTVQCDHEARQGFIGREEFLACWSIGQPDEIDFSKPVQIEIAASGQRRIRPQRRNSDAIKAV